VVQRNAEAQPWCHEDTEVVDIFAPSREDYLAGGEPTWLRKKAEGFKVSAFGKVWSELARVFFTSAAWVGAAMCPGRGHKRTFA
jgi:hypothetical protein